MFGKRSNTDIDKHDNKPKIVNWSPNMG